jgi:DNA-binding LytR/AlgR family response regulator
MKVEIKIDSSIHEPIVVVHTAKLTPELAALVEFIEGTETQPFLLTAKKDDKSFIIEPEQVEIIRAEGGTTKLYNRKAKDFTINRPLHELEERLGNNFIRISKSALVNINQVDHISPSFNGTMYIVLKNGVEDYISRNYLSGFKKRLGL